ncbi:MAG: hypothetical protein ABIU11_01435 [Chitinophagaceae bacterium]
MIKKKFCCAILFLFYAANTFSQDAASIIQQQFATYSNTHYHEKVFLHTDKTTYTTGEILWFKAYITDANTNNLSLLSKICYVEVISADKKPFMQCKIEIDSGTGSGSFTIPSSIRTGNYLIRAYTNWMKNFDAGFYFDQSISIINPGKKPDALKQDTASFSVQFFPEGGNLVYGLNSTVAFKFTNIHGKGVQGTGIIVNEKNDTIVNFAPEHFGMGTFSFNPVKGNKYHAVIMVNDKMFNRDLPEIYTNGWNLHLNDEGNMLQVNVACNIETEHNVFLLAQTKGSIKFAKMQYLNNGVAVFAINKSELGEGISQLTIFNENKQPVCERLYFKRPIEFLKIKLSNEQSDFQRRKKVSISVLAGDSNAKPVNADMSVSVYLIDSLQPAQGINVLNYLWLSSDIKGDVESPQYYFENTGKDVDKATDNLMLTQGWRRFNWEQVLNNPKPAFTYLPEHEGHIITGNILKQNASLPDTGIHVYLSVPGNNFKFSNSTSLASGRIRFNVEKFYGRHEIIAQPGMADSNYRIFIDNPFSEKFSEAEIEAIVLKSNLKNEILLRSIGAQSGNIYQPGNRGHYILPTQFDTTAFFGNPSKIYYLDDYTRFPAMEEVMREYIKEVRVRNRQNQFHYEVYNEVNKLYFDDDPLVLLDGVPVFNINKIMDVDPLKIKNIAIATTRFFRGQQIYNGIVSYSTYNADLEGYQLDPGSLVMEYEGLQFEREFYSPQYGNEQAVAGRIPDYRNVLYWSPHLKLINGKQDISFYTSDVPGNYIVIVQGISGSGLAGVGVSKFMVSK